MLENMVSSHNELRTIKTQADQLKSLNGSIITYAQYSTLMQSSANIYYASLSGNAKKHTRLVYMSKQSENLDHNDHLINDTTQCNIDSSIDMVQTNVHHNRPTYQRPYFQTNNRQPNNFQE